jgi:glycine/D-amino acid oxidase-like deaminating enzyme
MGAVTGKLVSDLIAGTDPIVDMAPFRPNRF